MKTKLKTMVLPIAFLALAPIALAQSKTDCPVPKGFKKQDTRTLSHGQSYTAPNGSRVSNTSDSSSSADITVYYYWNEATHQSFICVDVEPGANGTVNIVNGSCHDRVNVNGRKSSVHVNGNNPTIDIDGDENTVNYVGNGAHIDGSGMGSGNEITLGSNSSSPAVGTIGNYGGKDNKIIVNGSKNTMGNIGDNSYTIVSGNNNTVSNQEQDVSCN